MNYFDIRNHLIQRKMQVERYNHFIGEVDCTFLLFNLTGKICGYQTYNPLGCKDKRNDINGKYYTYFARNDLKIIDYGVFGLETLEYSNDILFITEGIFKCVPLHNRGYSAIATLCNDPKYLKNWFFILGKLKRIVFICEPDSAGNKFKTYGFEYFQCNKYDLDLYTEHAI